MSTAYYALFHLLIDEAVSRMVRARDRKVHRDLLRRAFEHGEMLKTCRAFSQLPGGQPGWLRNSGVAVGVDVRYVATAFDQLQHARHYADYDLTKRYGRAAALGRVTVAEAAFAAWNRARGGKDADLFVIALLARRGFERA